MQLPSTDHLFLFDLKHTNALLDFHVIPTLSFMLFKVSSVGLEPIALLQVSTTIPSPPQQLLLLCFNQHINRFSPFQFDSISFVRFEPPDTQSMLTTAHLHATHFVP